MKLIAKSLCLAFIIVSMASCKKDGTTTANKMSCVIDGKAWNSTVRVALLQSGIFTLTGTSLTGEIVAVTIKGETTGTYNLAVLPPSAQCAATYTASAIPANTDIYASVSGKVVLSKVDKTNKMISGTFEFTVSNSLMTVKSITQGQFNDLQYQ